MFLATCYVVSFLFYFLASVPAQLEQHLSRCLRVLFSPGKEESQAVLRFWEHLLDVLHDNLLLGAYSHCTVELQVRDGCVGRGNYVFMCYCVFLKLGECRTLWGEHEQAMHCSIELLCIAKVLPVKSIRSALPNHSIYVAKPFDLCCETIRTVLPNHLNRVAKPFDSHCHNCVAKPFDA